MDVITFPERELLLRPITASSAADIHPLMQDCYPSIYQHLWKDKGQWYIDHTFNKSIVLEELKEKEAPYWIIEWKSNAVGILRLNLKKTCPVFPTEPEALKLHRIYLHPRTHRQGIGQILTNFILEYARQLNRQIVWLEAMDTQTDALLFYEKMGFEIKGGFRLDFERMYPELRGMVRMVAEI